MERTRELWVGFFRRSASMTARIWAAALAKVYSGVRTKWMVCRASLMTVTRRAVMSAALARRWVLWWCAEGSGEDCQMLSKTMETSRVRGTAMTR